MNLLREKLSSKKELSDLLVIYLSLINKRPRDVIYSPPIVSNNTTESIQPLLMPTVKENIDERIYIVFQRIKNDLKELCYLLLNHHPIWISIAVIITTIFIYQFFRWIRPILYYI